MGYPEKGCVIFCLVGAAGTNKRGLPIHGGGPLHIGQTHPWLLNPDITGDINGNEITRTGRFTGGFVECLRQAGECRSGSVRTRSTGSGSPRSSPGRSAGSSSGSRSAGSSTRGKSRGGGERRPGQEGFW